MKKILKQIINIPLNVIGLIYRDYLTLRHGYLKFFYFNNMQYYITNNKNTIKIGDYIFIGNDVQMLK